MTSAISVEGLLVVDLLNAGQKFNTESFIQFLNQKLLPAMNPFDGYSPHSVLVMGMILFEAYIVYIYRMFTVEFDLKIS